MALGCSRRPAQPRPCGVSWHGAPAARRRQSQALWRTASVTAFPAMGGSNTGSSREGLQLVEHVPPSHGLFHNHSAFVQQPLHLLHTQLGRNARVRSYSMPAGTALSAALAAIVSTDHRPGQTSTTDAGAPPKPGRLAAATVPSCTLRRGPAISCRDRDGLGISLTEAQVGRCRTRA